MVLDHEIRKVIAWWQKQVQLDRRASMTLELPETDKGKKSEASRPTDTVGNATVEEEVPWEEEVQSQQEDDGDEGLIRQATELVRVKRRASASYLQRHLRLGYPRAAWLIDQLESRGVLGPPTGARKEREILIPESDDTENAVEE
jgi:DNA segregation ATPase FtsK/SpoIIIE-like protein